jgi:membrane peptidoglycan carboxypeptidase
MKGYVIYQNENNKNIPYGVVSEDYECQAETYYIPSNLKRNLIQFEDKRFFDHGGIDFRAIARATIENIKAGGIIQGGSTITQQLSRNIIRDNSKSFSRKIREIIKAIDLEKKFSKEEILDMYFNHVFFGKNLRGIRAAGLSYFGKEVENLNHAEQLYLLTILRGPNYYLKNQDKAFNRFRFLSKSLYENKKISVKCHKRNINSYVSIHENSLYPIKETVVDFIAKEINKKSKLVISTIDKDIQNFARRFVKESKYPISIIAVKNKQVLAFASSYGTDYPFILKTNVGSTLKPFIYCFLREQGISCSDYFNSNENELNWSVREVFFQNQFISLEDALFHSNNNAFINASSRVGLDKVFLFLSELLNKEITEFFPSSILGATKNGISLFELASVYSTYFDDGNLTNIKSECLNILNTVAKNKLKHNVENIFIKTGTTNDNKENLAIIKNADYTFAILRNENPVYDNSKDGNFMKYIKRSFSYLEKILKPNKNYKW